ncbi:MAG: hypothetical protein ACK5QS_09295 [Pseudanabaenaceae cyanobacterium]
MFNERKNSEKKQRKCSVSIRSVRGQLSVPEVTMDSFSTENHANTIAFGFSASRRLNSAIT